MKNRLNIKKFEYYVPKISRKTHIKEFLPSYKSAEKGLFQNENSNK